MNRRLTLATAAFFLAATASSAAEPRQEPPFLTGDPSTEEVLAWAEQHVSDLKHWLPLAPVQGFLALILDRPPDVSAYPVVEQYIRLERFLDAGRADQRSIAWVVSVDCREKASKVDKMINFDGNSLTGSSHGFEFVDAIFEKPLPNSLQQAYIANICEQARLRMAPPQ